MEQKIIQIGNSAGTIIPKALLDHMNLKPGNQIMIQQDPSGESIIITKQGSKPKSVAVDSRFLDILEKVNKEYGVALKELAKR